MEKVLTIIIPTYNMEKYLDKCLSSLIITNRSLLKTVEVLVVIDGAKDRSSEIAHSYESQYPQVFRVIDKENGNYGSCVNRGLAEASGKYVKILDADDWFDTNQFQKYLSKLHEIDVDLVLSNCTKVDEYGNSVGGFYITGIRPNVVVPFSSFYREAVGIQMHCVAYRTDMLRSIDYKQSEGISYTDQQWVTRPMSVVKNAFFIKVNLYHYLVGRTGQTMDIDVLTKKFKDEVVMVQGMLRWLDECQNRDIEKEYLWDKVIHHLTYLYYNHIVECVYNRAEFRAFSMWLIEKYPIVANALESQNVFGNIDYKFILKYHKDENYKIPLSVLRLIKRKACVKQLRSMVGGILRFLKLRA